MPGGSPNLESKTSVSLAVRRLMQVGSPHTYLLISAIGCGVVSAVATVVSTDFTARMTNMMISRDLEGFSRLVVPVVLLAASVVLLGSGRRHFGRVFSHRVVYLLRKGVVDRLVAAQAGSVEHSGQVLSRFTNDLGSAQSMMEQAVPLVVSSLQAALALAYMLWRNWLLALIAVFGTPLVFAVVGKTNRPLMDVSKKAQEALASTNESITESLSGAEIVRSFGLQNRMYHTFQDRANRWLALVRKRAGLASAVGAVGFGASFTPFILVFGIGGFMVLRGQILMGTLFAFMELLNYVSFPMQELPRMLAQMASDSAAVERVLHLLDLPIEGQAGTDFPLDPSVPAIEFKDVTFFYPGRGEAGDAHSGSVTPALYHASFSIRAGETVAMAGASGSGKTTVLRLLLGDYAPDSGQILVFGHDLKEWSIEALRSHISYVSQSTYLFPFSVKDNLILEKDGLSIDRVRAASGLSQAQGFIESLPDGYDTRVGEMGNRISVGERQRVSLSRAFLRMSDILLLDEATSALDNQSESQVIQAIRDNFADVTTMAIAHRLSSVQHAHRVLVFSQGRVVESGTHQELMDKRGRYYQLYNAQAEGQESSEGAPPEEVHPQGGLVSGRLSQGASHPHVALSRGGELR